MSPVIVIGKTIKKRVDLEDFDGGECDCGGGLTQIVMV